jgi:hypothetical protein
VAGAELEHTAGKPTPKTSDGMLLRMTWLSAKGDEGFAEVFRNVKKGRAP